MNITEITPQRSKKEENIRLAAYARVSSDSEEQLHSFATQIRYYSEYVKHHPEYQLVDIYADEDLTGTELENRDELNRLLRDCKSGKVDRIIVKSISRFARNTEELLMMLRLLKECDVSVYFEEQDIDTEKLNMEMIVTFPGMAAQQESEAISGNLRWSIKKRMESGDYNCTFTPYGYKRENGEMLVEEDEAKIVIRIFDLYLQGKGMQAIATQLNEENIPRRYGYVKWHQTSIQYILTNERYMGDALLQKHYTTDTLPFRQKRNKGEKQQFYVENSNVPIISRKTFEKAQALMQSRRLGYCSRIKHLLSGKMRCPECGSTFRRQSHRGKVYWWCMKAASRATNCESRRVREDMVYDAFTNMLYKLKQYRDVIIEPLIKQMEYVQERTNKNQERIAQIDKEIADIGAKNLVISRLHTSGVLNLADYTAQSSELSNRMTALRAEKKKKLHEASDDRLEDLKELDEIISECRLSSRFDCELFEQIVIKVVVDDNTKVTFHVIGGLSLTEEICPKGRCKTT